MITNFDTSDMFHPGQVTTLVDAAFGSSGKGKVASFITAHASSWQFACNAFMPNACHDIVDDAGKRWSFRTLGSPVLDPRMEKLFLGPGAVIDLALFASEMEAAGLSPARLGVHPLAAVLQDLDTRYEQGRQGLDGEPTERHQGTAAFGSTCRGVGAARARRLLRRPTARLAKDAPELRPYLCDTSAEIMARLDRGQSGLLEVAQGFGLSLLGDFYPHCTSRNCTVAAGFDDMMLPLRYVGPVVLSARTFPTRVGNSRYVAPDGRHMDWRAAVGGAEHEELRCDSGGGYSDQVETTWTRIQQDAGLQQPLTEETLRDTPRRVFTFSRKGLAAAVRHNDTGQGMWLSMNFGNYVDGSVTGKRGEYVVGATAKLDRWLRENVHGVSSTEKRVHLRLVGTGPRTEDMLHVSANTERALLGVP